MNLNIQQKIIIATVLIIFVLSFYDDLFHLLLEIFHLLFEGMEFVLDLIIEYLLEMGTYKTQVVVFYILVAIICYGVYRLYRFISNRYHKLEQFLHKQKQQTLAEWNSLSMLEKVACWCFSIIAINAWLFLI